VERLNWHDENAAWDRIGFDASGHSMQRLYASERCGTHGNVPVRAGIAGALHAITEERAAPAAGRR